MDRTNINNTNNINTQQTNAQLPETIVEESAEAFRRRSKIQHSPPLTQNSKETPTRGGDVFLTPSMAQTPKTTDVAANSPSTDTPASAQSTPVNSSSPRQEFIMKMRAEEDMALAKCRATLRKMKLGMTKQKNINIDVKTGVLELDELLDIIGSLRRNWTTAETAAKNSTKPLKSISAQTDQLEETPKPTTKRLASSPAEQGTGKRARENNAGSWQTRGRKKAKSPNQPPKATQERVQIKKADRRDRVRPEAVLIKPAEGRSYAEVLQSVRQYVKSGENKVEIRGIRKTKTGALLLEMDKGEKAKPELREALKCTLQNMASVSELKSKSTIEIRDLDSLTTTDEVSDAIKGLINVSAEEVVIRVSKPNSREQKCAYVTMPTNYANEAFKKGRIKIGWINCRMRICKDVTKCYRCFGFGHLQRECKGPNRKGEGLCIKCGKPGHKLKDCKNQPSCCLCLEKGHKPHDHIPGSRTCTSYKQVADKT